MRIRVNSRAIRPYNAIASDHMKSYMAKIITLIATDIFGKTDALRQLVDDIPGESKILDPYGGKVITFSDEAQAYAVFNQQVGHDNFAEGLRQEINNTEGAFQLLGFSAGATACWRNACEDKNPDLLQAICIYGSQIRHYCHLRPTAPTTIVLPARENSFDVTTHAEVLAKVPLTTLKKTPYLHGYMNRLSLNFDKDGYSETLHWLKTIL